MHQNRLHVHSNFCVSVQAGGPQAGPGSPVGAGGRRRPAKLVPRLLSHQEKLRKRQQFAVQTATKVSTEINWIFEFSVVDGKLETAVVLTRVFQDIAGPQEE